MAPGRAKHKKKTDKKQIEQLVSIDEDSILDNTMDFPSSSQVPLLEGHEDSSSDEDTLDTSSEALAVSQENLEMNETFTEILYELRIIRTLLEKQPSTNDLRTIFSNTLTNVTQLCSTMEESNKEQLTQDANIIR